MRTVLGIDIGGSGVKGAPVDVDRGELTGTRFRIPTPRPATPDDVMDVAAGVVDHFGWSGPVGCALPAVVDRGIVRTAANIDPSWIGTDARALLAKRTNGDVAVLNDADAAGIAEMKFGAGSGREGVVLLLTFGTGIGSAVFADGTLLPNTELGHLEFRGSVAEHYAAARLVEEDVMDLQAWAQRVNEYRTYVELVLAPGLIIFGGGISEAIRRIRRCAANSGRSRAGETSQQCRDRRSGTRGRGA